MKNPATLFASPTRRLLLAGLLLLVGPGPAALAQVAVTSYYSRFAAPQATDHYAVRRNGVLCAGCGVANPELAADNSLTNYATVQQSLGAGNQAALRLRLNGTAARSYRTGVVVGSGAGLNASALDAIVLRTYEGGVLRETRRASASGVTASTTADGRTRIEFITQQSADQLEAEVTITANVLNTLDVYYAFAVPANVVEQATGYVSRLATPTAADYEASAGGGLLCADSGVQNPLNAVTPALTDHATMHVTGVGCTSTLQVRLEGPAPAGYQAGFVLGSSRLLDASVLNSLKIKTYKNGVLQETGSAANLLELKVLPDGKYQVSFRTSQEFDHVELEKTGLVGLLDDLDVYYGFGVEAAAFQDTTPIRSDFAAGQTGGTFQVGGSCPNCIHNPGFAADADLNNYAQINFPTISVGGSQVLRLRVNGDANAGNRAGMALSFNNGLLSNSLLGSVTIRTYAADGVTPLESASGTGLLSTGLLGSNVREIGFMTTQDFEWVEVEINNSIGLGTSAQVYYAFADDPVIGFPSSITPPAVLPVQLRAFVAKATAAAVELSWETAAEKNSQYFAVERASTADGRFREIGRVQAAGTSTTARRYALRDAEAAQLDAGLLYYRLRQVDHDGTTAYSDVQVVRWQPAAPAVRLTLYPNPAAGTASVLLSAGLPAEGNTLCLYTPQGRLLRRQALQPHKAVLELQGVPAGLYQVVLLDAQGRRLAHERLSVLR